MACLGCVGICKQHCSSSYLKLTLSLKGCVCQCTIYGAIYDTSVKMLWPVTIHVIQFMWYLLLRLNVGAFLWALLASRLAVRPTDQPILPSPAFGVWQPPACRSSQWSDGPIGLLAQGWERWDGGHRRVIRLLPLLQCLWAPGPWIPPSLQGPDPDSLSLSMSFSEHRHMESQRQKLYSPTMSSKKKKKNLIKT